MTYRRFAVYYTPPAGAFADFGANWLGWDLAAGRAQTPPEPDAVATPARYGFHATLKPPMRLAPGKTPGTLAAAIADLATRLAPARCGGLRLARLGKFLALVPDNSPTEIRQIADTCVATLDPYRAPAPQDELRRRRAAGLTSSQEANLARWGYPFVMDDFRFHMTLTGRLDDATATRIEARLARDLTGRLPRPFTFDALSLVGEDADGYFHLIERFPLSD